MNEKQRIKNALEEKNDKARSRLLLGESRSGNEGWKMDDELNITILKMPDKPIHGKENEKMDGKGEGHDSPGDVRDIDGSVPEAGADVPELDSGVQHIGPGGDGGDKESCEEHDWEVAEEFPPWNKHGTGMIIETEYECTKCLATKVEEKAE